MPLSHSPITAAILLILAAAHLSTSFSQDVTFPNCTHTFSCGSLRDVSYPFTGGDRPHHCGPPEFRLTCRDNYAELNTASLTYRVLHINQTQNTLTLARLDLWNNTCPTQFLNSTLNTSIFSYGVHNEQLSLIYGCDSSAMNFTPYNQFACNVSGVDFSDAYYLMGPLPTDPIVGYIRCSVRVTIPVLDTAGEGITSNRTTVGEALTQGFNVNYSDPYYRQCTECTTRSRRQCGFNSNSGQPICICGDRLCSPAGIPLSPCNCCRNYPSCLGLVDDQLA